ncbi:hypothetical protein [Cupriavidus sp. 8B]
MTGQAPAEFRSVRRARSDGGKSHYVNSTFCRATVLAYGIRAGANPADWLGTMSANPLLALRFQAWDGHDLH